MVWLNETGTNDFTGYYGFIYRIDYTDGTYYFGKKTFVKRIKRPPLKGKKRVRIDYVESDWRKYNGSSKDAGTRVIQRKTILELAKTQGRLTYLENKKLYEENVLLKLDCLNANIGGKIWAKTISREPIKWSVQCVSDVL